MAASFVNSCDNHSSEFEGFDSAEEDESEIEYFDPFGQMNNEVREILLKLAREERSEQLARDQSINFDQASNTEEQEFYGHYSF